MLKTVCTGYPVYGGVFGVEADGAVWGSGNISSLLFNKESILRNNGVTEAGNPSFSKAGACFGRNTALSSRPDIFSRPGVGRTTGWKEKNACRGAPLGARALSTEILHRTEKKGVVSDGHWNRPWILCHQNKAGVFPHRDHPV